MHDEAIEPTHARESWSIGQGDCPRARDAAAFLTGDLAKEACASYETHLAACAACRRAVEANRRTLAMLTAAPARPASRDLAPAILERLDHRRDRTAAIGFRGWRGVAAAAAAALLLFWGAAVLWHLRPGSLLTARVPVPPRDLNTNADQALDWLCRAQEPDGSWSAARWGGESRFQVALTALSLLALQRAEPVTAGRSSAMRRAVEYLRSQQSPSGEFGSAFDNAPYNQGLATLAMLTAYRRERQGDVRRSLDAALALICSRQTPEGGWGYLQQGTGKPNLSVTLWQLEALRLAGSLGWESVRSSVARGTRWVASTVDEQGQFGYRRMSDFPAGPQTLTAMGAMAVLRAPESLLPEGRRVRIQGRVREAAALSSDASDYYRTYFLTAAMREMQDDASALQLAAIRHLLASRQVTRGEEKGSWPLDDAWGSVGGRVYATSMACMALR